MLWRRGMSHRSIAGMGLIQSARRGGSRTSPTLRAPFILRTFPPLAGETLSSCFVIILICQHHASNGAIEPCLQ